MPGRSDDIHARAVHLEVDTVISHERPSRDIVVGKQFGAGFYVSPQRNEIRVITLKKPRQT